MPNNGRASGFESVKTLRGTSTESRVRHESQHELRAARVINPL